MRPVNGICPQHIDARGINSKSAGANALPVVGSQHEAPGRAGAAQTVEVFLQVHGGPWVARTGGLQTCLRSGCALRDGGGKPLGFAGSEACCGASERSFLGVQEGSSFYFWPW